MDTLKCTKLDFHRFAERQGWLLLYDNPRGDGSSVSYLLQDGNCIVADFDDVGLFKSLTDITNARTEVDSDSQDAKMNGDENGDE
jgi:hypothetical protein